MTIFDSHFHIIDKQFPLVENNGFLPETFTVENYQLQADTLNITSGAVVSGSFQAFDQTYLIAALKQLGTGFVGVTQLPASCSDEDILTLNQAGVRAVRFNLKRGGSEDISHINDFAHRIFELANWHVELYLDSSELKDLFSILNNLPKVSIDHLGLSSKDFITLLKLVDQGLRIKASGFGRIDLDPVTAMKEIIAINPDALMFGTDLPCTRAPRPFHYSDLQLIVDTFDAQQCHKILYENAHQWYQPGRV